MTAASPQLLREVRQIVRDGVGQAHPWFRDPRTWPAGAGLPRTIPAARVQELLRGLLAVDGAPDPVNNLRSLNVEHDAVRAEVYALDADGQKFARGEDVAIDQVHMRIDWSRPAGDA